MIVLYFHVDRTNYNLHCYLHYVKGHNRSDEASSPKCYQLEAIWELQYLQFLKTEILQLQRSQHITMYIYMCVNLCKQRVKKHYLEKEIIGISFVYTHTERKECAISHFSDTQARTRVVDQCISKGEKSVKQICVYIQSVCFCCIGFYEGSGLPSLCLLSWGN